MTSSAIPRPNLSSFLPVLLAAVTAGLGPARPAAAVGVEAIPSPRPAGWSVDLTGSISPAVLRDLDVLAERVHADTGGELVIVVVDTVDGAQPRAFATRLFNTWGVGSRERDDGVLVFLALADRAAEIVLGDGLDGPEGRAASDRAMQEAMIPRFRTGATGEGLRAGARVLADEIFGVVEPQSHASAAGAPAPAPSPPRVERPPRPRPPTSAHAAPRETLPAAPRRRSPGATTVLVLVLSLGGLAGLTTAVTLARRPAKCPSCGVRRIQLDEVSEDEHLEPVERLEDEIGSVDHQVWICPSCGDVAEIARARWFSGYSTCSACAAKTWRSSEHVLTDATTESSGLAQVDGWCVSCDHRSSYTRTIPRKIDWNEESSDSTSDSPLLSSSGSPSSWTSSRSSGFGGGRSSGGGSSGRW